MRKFRRIQHHFSQWNYDERGSKTSKAWRDRQVQTEERFGGHAEVEKQDEASIYEENGRRMELSGKGAASTTSAKSRLRSDGVELVKRGCRKRSAIPEKGLWKIRQLNITGREWREGGRGGEREEEGKVSRGDLKKLRSSLRTLVSGSHPKVHHLLH